LWGLRVRQVEQGPCVYDNVAERCQCMPKAGVDAGTGTGLRSAEDGDDDGGGMGRLVGGMVEMTEGWCVGGWLGMGGGRGRGLPVGTYSASRTNMGLYSCNLNV